jgi:hypothetical protein
MPLIAYLDEAGDHSMDKIDPQFPVFVLVLLVCDTTTYAQQIVPEFYQLKLDYFGHEAVVIHSRDIRRGQGDFAFLTDPSWRQPFYERINEIMGKSTYSLIACAIHKQKHKERYGSRAYNPYDLALKFTLERLLPLLESVDQSHIKLIAEARGEREDDDLRLAFLEVVTKGTGWNNAERFRAIEFDLRFVEKKMNLIGTQMADLAAYPIARYTLSKETLNRAFDVIESKFYIGRGRVRGLKEFP